MVDPLDAVGRGRGAYRDRRPNVVELEVVSIPSDLDDVYDVLGVAGVGNPLRTHSLIGVVTRAGDLEGLVYVPALGLLLDVLVDPIAEVEEVVVAVTLEEALLLLVEEALLLVEEEAVFVV